MSHSCPNKKFLITFIPVLFIAAFCCCTGAEKSHIKTITSAGQLDKITAKAKNRLLIFDLYDEGCMSCYMLFSMLEEIAREQKDKATIYKIKIADNPDIAKTFGVTSRPFVVYMKNKKVIYSFAGIRPKDSIVNAINLCTQSAP